jgi:hypothetical protein
MAIRKSIRTYLQGLTGVSTTCEGRVFWFTVREAEKLPCILCRITGGEQDDLTSCDPSGPQMVLVEVQAMSRDAEEAISLGDELMGFSGMHGASWTEDSTAVQISRLTDVLEDRFDPEPFNAYVCGAVFAVTYQPVSA